MSLGCTKWLISGSKETFDEGLLLFKKYVCTWRRSTGLRSKNVPNVSLPVGALEIDAWSADDLPFGQMRQGVNYWPRSFRGLAQVTCGTGHGLLSPGQGHGRKSQPLIRLSQIIHKKIVKKLPEKYQNKSKLMKTVWFSLAKRNFRPISRVTKFFSGQSRAS